MNLAPRFLSRFWDWKSGLLIAVAVLLTLAGIVVLLGGSGGAGALGRPWLRQLIWFWIGVGAAGILMFFDYRFLVRHSYAIYAMVLVLLVITQAMGKVVYGAKSWLTIPGLHIGIQPSEFAKLAVILVLSKVLGAKLGVIRGLKDLLYPMALVAIPAVLILKQPDLGTTMVLAPLTLGLFYLAGLSWVYLVFFAAPLMGFLALAPGSGAKALWVGGLVLIALLMRWKSIPWLERIIFWSFYIGSYFSMEKLWALLKPHQRSRFLVFWDPEYDLSGAGYNLYQSKIAIGSGGFLGKGFGQGTQSRLQFLPESHTDFTFAVLAEDWGFLGCVVFFVLFLFMIFLCLEIARASRNVEGSLLAGGIGIYFLTHFTINVGMAMGMLPVAGLPLSFLSYGGSHLLVCLIGLGLVLNVKFRRFQ